jgi:hypothetical protein
VQPEAQAEQLAALVEPGGLYGVEETHREHDAALATLEKVPAGHGSGAALPAGQKDPTIQDTHALAPAVAENRPGLHGVQAVEFSRENVPAAHNIWDSEAGANNGVHTSQTLE